MAEAQRSAQRSTAQVAFARLTLALGSLVFLHAAYSTYESVSVQKAVGLSSTEIPIDIKTETFLGLFIVLLGAVLTASPLRKVTWASEYRKRTIDQIDARPNFVALNHRGPYLFGSKAG